MADKPSGSRQDLLLDPPDFSFVLGGPLFQLFHRTRLSGTAPRSGLFLHHDDAMREFAYDRASAAGKLDRGLDEAPKRGWTLGSIKKDWKRVFSFEK